jgi:phosphohistidine phosphatase
MELLIVRHGPAGSLAEKAVWKLSGQDHDRPLTKDGLKRTKEAAAGLARLVEDWEIVATSPWKRAAQTAAAVAKALDAELVECPALIPDARLEDSLAWLKARKEKKIALVGHEPHLSELASWLLTGAKRSVLRLKKPQALLVDLKKLEAGAGELVWSIPPRSLRALAR